ncbi:MAG TPA: YaiI/YqxD family protein [Gammaproteobacteria bacterium]|nr:YaiI/YqxD family protein [Gammaproteobacteria bacterium]
MKIWVDADGCPSAMREILTRAAERKQVELILVANRILAIAPSEYIRAIKVKAGFDVADNEIVRLVNSGDLVITADIPLAAEVIEKGALALSPRGELFTDSNIRARLNMRDFMDTMRSSGLPTGGPPPLGNRERKAFADQLDRLLTAGAVDP